jgi:hypothetical protein
VSSGRSAVVVVLAAVLALVAAGTARADGDPASDFLLTQKVFLPYDASISATRSAQLAALADDAARDGYPIRIALIASPTDLGSVTSLWAKPQQYAKFLAAEVSFAYRGRLLIVMPAGLGTYQLGHPSDSQQRALAGLKVAPGANGLAATAITAVERLAAARGITLRAPQGVSPSKRTSDDRLRLGLIVAAALVVAVALLPVMRLRRRRRR